MYNPQVDYPGYDELLDSLTSTTNDRNLRAFVWPKALAEAHVEAFVVKEARELKINSQVEVIGFAVLHEENRETK